jgi:hypothetical protein
MAVSGAASRQHGVVRERRRRRCRKRGPRHWQVWRRLHGPAVNAAPLWRTVAATAAGCALGSQRTRERSISVDRIHSLHLRASSRRSLARPNSQGTVPRCCAAPSQATATATAITPLRVVGLVHGYLPTYCACACTCTCTSRRAPSDIRPPRPQRLMKQEEGGAVATTCDAAEQPVDTAF